MSSQTFGEALKEAHQADFPWILKRSVRTRLAGGPEERRAAIPGMH